MGKELTLLFDSVSIRRAAKATGKNIEYLGLLQGIKMLYELKQASLYVIRNLSAPEDQFNNYVEKMRRAGFDTIAQEVDPTDGYYDFAPQLCLDAVAATTEYVALGTNNISILPALRHLKANGHHTILFSTECPRILEPWVDSFYTTVH